MTIKEAILKSMEDIHRLTNYMEVYQHMVAQGYYDFKEAKTPASTVSAQLGEFIRKSDTRVKRVKGEGGTFSYYLAKYESEIELFNGLAESDDEVINNGNHIKGKSTFEERDLHLLLSSYLKNDKVYSKTIFHEKSQTSKDSHQKWVHPDMVGISFLKLQSKPSQQLLKAVSRVETFKLTSYELKKEINTDYDLKKCFFQAVSNSSWANYGYLVALEISESLYEEMKRLNESFGIGIIQLRPNPYESKILFTPQYRDLDFKTIDKLCKINSDFAQFVEQVEKLLTAAEKYVSSTEKELEGFCDPYFKTDSEMEEYIKKKQIKIEEEN